MTTRRKAHTINNDDRRIDASEFFRQYNMVDLIVAITPCDVEEIDGIKRILFKRGHSLRPDGWINRLRVKHLFK